MLLSELIVPLNEHERQQRKLLEYIRCAHIVQAILNHGHTSKGEVSVTALIFEIW